MLLRYGELNPSLLKTKDDEKSPPPRLPKHVYIIGVLAGMLTCIAFLPQVIKVIGTRTPSALTWTTLFICIAGQALWVAYGGMAKDKILSIFSIISLLLYLCLMCSKVLPFFNNTQN